MGKEKIRILFDKKDKRVKRTKRSWANWDYKATSTTYSVLLREKVQAPNG